MRTNAFIRAIILKTELEEKMGEGTKVVEDTITEARESVWAIPLGNNQVLISAAHEDPNVAYQLVNTTIENFIQWKKNSQQVESETAFNFFEDLLNVYKDDLEATRTELENYLISHPEPERGNRPDLELLEIERLQSDLQLAGTRFAKAQDSVESARLALAQVESDTNQTYILIDNPTIPIEPEFSLKDVAVQIALFIVSGIVLSIIGVGGSVLLDRSFRFPVDVRNLLELPVLASIPDMAEPKKTKRNNRESDRAAKKVAKEERKISKNASLSPDKPFLNGNPEVDSDSLKKSGLPADSLEETTITTQE
jgi:capsular polysaccharide biosynthesis protein